LRWPHSLQTGDFMFMGLRRQVILLPLLVDAGFESMLGAATVLGSCSSGYELRQTSATTGGRELRCILNSAHLTALWGRSDS
jgi:hypothetical protein